MRDLRLSRLYTLAAVLLTLYALWSTGVYAYGLYQMFALRNTNVPPLLAQMMRNAVPWWQELGGVLGVMVWWVLAGLGWLLRCDHGQRAVSRQAASAVPPVVGEGAAAEDEGVWPPKPETA